MHVVAAVGDLVDFKNWIDDTLVGFIVVLMGAVIASRAHKKDTKGAMEVGGVVLIGLLFVGIGTTVDALTEIENFLVRLITSL